MKPSEFFALFAAVFWIIGAVLLLVTLALRERDLGCIVHQYSKRALSFAIAAAGSLAVAIILEANAL